VRRVDHDHAVDSLGVIEAEHHGRPAAPVMTDQLDLLDPECVEKRDLVARERLPVVSAAGGLGRTEPTQIRGEHPELRRQPVKNPPPQFVGLGPAVEQQDWVPRPPRGG
jgi:hypothetical protein